MYNVLLTGINGFLGSHIAKRLAGNHKIIGIGTSAGNLSRLEGYPIEVYKSETDVISRIVAEKKIDVIIHTATLYGRHDEDVHKVVNSNFLMPFHLLDVAIKNKVATFINTDTVLDRFVNLYSLTKRQFNDWLLFRNKEINVINMQLEHFYGPGCSNSNFITAMVGKLEKNELFIDLTKGEQKRDFIFYSDIVDAYELVVNKLNNIDGAYKNFQVGSGEHITIRALMEQLKVLTKSTTTLNFGAVSYRPNELMESTTDNSALKALGWKPQHSILEGLKKTIN